MAMGQYGGDEEEFATEEYVEQPGELDLDDGEEGLPWLEGDEDYDQSGAADNTRIITVALIGMAVVLAAIAAFWWFGRDGTDPALVADGSTIEAPEGDYKEKPEDPGGKEFEGTGDASYRVAEGEEAEGRLGSGDAPRPTIDTDQNESAGTSASSSATETTSASGVAVQVGAYSTRGTAQQGWSELTSRYSALSGAKHRIVEGQADIGTVYRLQAVTGDRSSANALCSALKAQGAACQVK